MSALALEDLAPEAAPKTEIDDYDRDSIHTLALAALPLNTKGLKRALDQERSTGDPDRAVSRRRYW